MLPYQPPHSDLFRFYMAIAEEDFKNADKNQNGSLDLEEYKNSNYGMGRVPNFIHDGFYEHFHMLDTDKDGRLDREEYVHAAGQDHFTQMDYNSDGMILYEEFRKHKHTHYWSPNKAPVPPEADNTRAGFAQLDLNKDGKISRAEETYALMPSEEEVQAALARGDDADGDDEEYDAGVED